MFIFNGSIRGHNKIVEAAHETVSLSSNLLHRFVVHLFGMFDKPILVYLARYFPYSDLNYALERQKAKR